MAVASAALALVLTVIVTVQPTLAEMFFGPVTLELKGVIAALGLAFLIIPLMEIYKAIMRAVEKSNALVRAAPRPFSLTGPRALRCGIVREKGFRGGPCGILAGFSPARMIKAEGKFVSWSGFARPALFDLKYLLSCDLWCWEALVGKAKAKAKKKTTGARAKRDRRRKLATEAPASAEELLASVPGLDALQDVPTFDDLPVDDAQRAAFDDFCARAEEPEQMQLGAVVRLDRGFPLVATADDTFRAEHAVGFAKSRGEDEVLLPAVGDRVAVRRAPGHDMGVIECVLPRRTSFERWRGRARGERQVLCSNVDSVLIVQALGAGEVLLDRVARSLVLALDCDAEPVVVLTKADRCDADELERDLDRVHRLVGPDVRVIVTSSAEGRGLDEVRACVPAGSCAMILGESGAGKSTLLTRCWATIRWRPAACASAMTRAAIPPSRA